MNMFKTLKQEKWFLLGIFFCAVIIRLLYFHVFLQDNPCVLAFDSGHYHELATQIADGKGFTKLDGTPQFYRLPGYSVFLAICYKLFDFNILVTLLMQIILASLIPVLLFFLALRLFPHDLRTAKIAAVIGCIHHGFVIFSGLVMTESLFMLFFLLFLLMLFNSPITVGTMLSAGIFLGCASMMRSVGLPLLLLTLIVIFTFTLTQQQKRKAMVMLCAGWLLVTGMLLARNFMLTGHIFLDTLSGAHLLNHHVVPVVMKAENITHAQAKQKVYTLFEERKQEKERLLQRPLHEIEQCYIAGRIAQQMTWRYFFFTAEVEHAVFNMIKTCFSLYAAELLVIDSGGQLPPYDNQRGLCAMIKRFLAPDVSNHLIVYAIYYEIILFCLLIFGFFGALLVIRDHHFLNVFCTRMLPFMFVFIGLSFACGFARLRLPTEPFFIIVASRFWSLVMQRKKGDA